MTVPYNLGMEAAILGAVLYDNGCFETVRDLVTEDQFYAPAHRAIFALIRDTINNGGVADGLTLQEAVTGTDKVAEIGGTKYLFDLLDSAAIGPEVRDYCNLVSDMARRRDLMAIGNELVQAAATTGADDVLDAHDLALEHVREQGGNHIRVESCADGLEDVFASTDRDSLVTTGFSTLDEACKGFERGALSIIAARPGVGKTAFAICVAEAIAQTESVGFLSLDMQGKVIKQRLACFLHWKQPGYRRTPMVSQLKDAGGLSDDERASLEAMLKSDTARRILVNDRGGQSTRTVSAQIRAWHKYCRKAGLPPLGAVFIDHIAKVAPAQKAGTLYEKTSFATNELLDIAKANPRTAIIALCQLSRETEKSHRRPIISDLRDSGKIEEDASLVLLLHREEMRLSMIAKNKASSPEDIAKANHELLRVKGDFEVIIGKNRNSEQGAVVLHSSMAFNAIRDARGAQMEEAV